MEQERLRLLRDLELYRADRGRGGMGRPEQLRRLSELRLELLRSRRRPVALVPGEGMAGGERLDAALETAIPMLGAEADASPLRAPTAS